MWIELANWIIEICRENILYIIGYDVKKIKAKNRKLVCELHKQELKNKLLHKNHVLLIQKHEQLKKDMESLKVSAEKKIKKMDRLSYTLIKNFQDFENSTLPKKLKKKIIKMNKKEENKEKF